jgi:hypothetical protein
MSVSVVYVKESVETAPMYRKSGILGGEKKVDLRAKL